MAGVAEASTFAARPPGGRPGSGRWRVVALRCAWMVARGTGVLVVEQFAAVAMIPALVLRVFGWRAASALVFPLAFLLSGRAGRAGAVPWLMQLTADSPRWHCS